MKTYDTISKDFIYKHLMENYGEVKHDLDQFVKAIRKTAKEFGMEKKSLFHYIIGESKPSMLTSYGFDTAYGREVRDTFSHNFYNS